MKYRYIIVMVVNCFLFSFLYSQTGESPANPDDPTGSIKVVVTSAVQSKFGTRYDAVDITVLDSLIYRGKDKGEWGILKDENGLLKGCIFFDAEELEGFHDNSIMGIYKNGAIAWSTDSTLWDIWADFFAIADINKDGKIEILVERYPPSNISIRRLWIIRWDGTTGSIINDVDDEDKNSTIISSSDMFQIVDSDTTSPMSIRGYWDDGRDSTWFPSTAIPTRPWVTYSWNGEKYGLWPSTAQIGGEQYLAANMLTSSVQCSMESQEDSLVYLYCIQNASSSKQALALFALGNVGILAPNSSPNLEYWGYSAVYKFATWVTFPSIGKGAIPAGNGTSITIRSKDLPGIVPFYTQGSRPLPEINTSDSKESIISAYVSDLFNNSYKGTTIAPSDLPSPFIPLNFLDTLISYTNQCASLGWVSTSIPIDIGVPSPSKIPYRIYLNDFAYVKSDLQSGNIITAISNLQGVVSQTVSDMANGYLTSEGYALLRFNTEYLITQLQNKIRYVPSQYATIQAAVNASKNGDYIVVADGTYNEQVTIENKDSLELKAEWGAYAVVAGITLKTSNQCVIHGMVVEAQNQAIGIGIYQSTNTTIEANDVEQASTSGIYIDAASSGTALVNNSISSNTGSGLSFAEDLNFPEYIVNNTIADNGGDGIQTANGRGIVLTNNIISFNNGYGIGRESSGTGDGVTLTANIIIGNGGDGDSQDIENSPALLDSLDQNNMTTTGTEGAGITGASSITESELFNYDYTLVGNSPAIDTGTSSGLYVPATDKAGTTRPLGNGIDIGAYEYVAPMHIPKPPMQPLGK